MHQVCFFVPFSYLLNFQGFCLWSGQQQRKFILLINLFYHQNKYIDVSMPGATGIVINLQKTNKKFICEFPVIFLKVMVLVPWVFFAQGSSVQQMIYQCFDIFKCFPLLVEKILILHYLKLGLKLIIFQIVGLYYDKYKDQSRSSYSSLLWNQIVTRIVVTNLLV